MQPVQPLQPWQVVALMGAGLALGIGALFLRVRSGGRYEVKIGDLAFLIVPLIFFGLATGRLKELAVGDVRVDLSGLFADAAKAEIGTQVVKTPPASVQDVMQVTAMASKGGVQEIPHLIERKTEALSFRFGAGGYYGPAIRTYMEKLSGSAYLRYVVLQNPDGTLFGIFGARTLIGWLGVGGDPAYGDFERNLNSNSEGARASVARLPGFVGADKAVRIATSKREALARMATLDVDSLPVVDDQRRFIGIVDRSKLTASLILAVTDRLEGPGARPASE